MSGDESIDSRYEPLFDYFGRETGRAIIDFAEDLWQMAVSFAEENVDRVNRLLGGEHGQGQD